MAQGLIDALNRVYKFNIHMTIRNMEMVTGFHCRDVLVPNTSPEEAHAEIKPWVLGAFRAALTRQAQITKLACTRLNDGAFFDESFTATPGQYNVDTTSTMLALTAAFKSNNRSRKANGRMFLPYAGPPDADRAQQGTLDAWNTAMAALMTLVGGVIIVGQMKLVVVGQNPAQVKDGPTIEPRQWNDVVAIRVNPIVTSVRSRRAGVGS